jgi:hypothetical protein
MLTFSVSCCEVCLTMCDVAWQIEHFLSTLLPDRRRLKRKRAVTQCAGFDKTFFAFKICQCFFIFIFFIYMLIPCIYYCLLFVLGTYKFTYTLQYYKCCYMFRRLYTTFRALIYCVCWSYNILKLIKLRQTECRCMLKICAIDKIIVVAAYVIQKSVTN